MAGTYSQFLMGEDFDKIVNGNPAEISDEYFDEMIRVYPKLEEKFRELFDRPE